MRKFLPIGVILLLLLLHLPFLTADPDSKVDVNTRGAWTDEGLYSSQIRNYIITGNFNIKENSTFVRGPLYNIIQFPFFMVFGSSQLVSRLIVLMSVLLVLFLFLKDKQLQLVGLFFTFMVLTQYQIFHFSHYGLAEMLCNSLVLASLWFLIRYHDKPTSKTWNMVVSTAFLFAAYSCKIQFLYVAAILPVVTFMLGVIAMVVRKKAFTEAFKGFFLSVGFTLLFALIYLGWYLGNKEFYNYIMLNEVNGRYPGNLHDILAVSRFNVSEFLWIGGLKYLWILLLLSFCGFVFLVFRRKINSSVKIVMLFSLIWMILEIHKIPMTYLPNRYLISLYVAAGLFISAVFSVLISTGKPLKIAIYLICVIVLFFNLSAITRSFRSRTYDIQAVNDYLKRCPYKADLAMGSWATAVSWDTDLITIPVWNDYFNWKDPIRTFKPELVIVEENEAETDKAFSSNGISLDQLSDSSRLFNIWRYKVKVYWVKSASTSR